MTVFSVTRLVGIGKSMKTWLCTLFVFLYFGFGASHYSNAAVRISTEVNRITITVLNDHHFHDILSSYPISHGYCYHNSELHLFDNFKNNQNYKRKAIQIIQSRLSEADPISASYLRQLLKVITRTKVTGKIIVEQWNSDIIPLYPKYQFKLKAGDSIVYQRCAKYNYLMMKDVIKKTQYLAKNTVEQYFEHLSLSPPKKLCVIKPNGELKQYDVGPHKPDDIYTYSGSFIFPCLPETVDFTAQEKINLFNALSLVKWEQLL